MYSNRDTIGNVIRHFNQKLRSDGNFGKSQHGERRRLNHDRERRHQLDELTLLQKVFPESNKTFAELQCELHIDIDRPPSPPSTPNPTKFHLVCNRTWDSVLCWPETPAGTTAYLPCFEEFNGIRYDPSGKFIKVQCLFSERF